MNEIVFTKKGEIFTNSLVIAQGTNNEHRSIRKLIERYKNDLEVFG